MSGNVPLDPIIPISAEEGTASPKIVTTLQYPWEEVTKAYNSRFPTHPDFPYLKGTIMPYHRIFPNKEEHLTRIVQLDMGFPSWIKKMTGTEVFTVREDVVINKQERKMTLISCNVTLYNQVRMYEEACYQQHPENPNWTLKEQIAYLDIVYCKKHVCLGLKKSMETFARNLFMSRSHGAAKQEIELIKSICPTPSPSPSPSSPSSPSA